MGWRKKGGGGGKRAGVRKGEGWLRGSVEGREKIQEGRRQKVKEESRVKNGDRREERGKRQDAVAEGERVEDRAERVERRW